MGGFDILRKTKLWDRKNAQSFRNSDILRSGGSTLGLFVSLVYEIPTVSWPLVYMLG